MRGNLRVNGVGQVWRPNASAIIKSSFGGAKGEQQRCGSLTPHQNKPPPREKLERGTRFLEVRSAHPINGSRGIWFPTSRSGLLKIIYVLSDSTDFEVQLIAMLAFTWGVVTGDHIWRSWWWACRRSWRFAHREGHSPILFRREAKPASGAFLDASIPRSRAGYFSNFDGRAPSDMRYHDIEVASIGGQQHLFVTYNKFDPLSKARP